MSTRPPILFPLFAGIETLDGVGPRTAKHLAALDITRPRDLLFTLPWSGVDRPRRATVQGAPIPGVVTVEVVVGRHEEEGGETTLDVIAAHAVTRQEE